MKSLAPVTEILNSSEALKRKIVAGGILSEDKISFNAPYDLPKIAQPYLLVFLYSATPNVSLRNYEEPIRYVSQDGRIHAKAEITAPPAATDLHYLFVPYGADPASELVLTGDLIRLFHNQPLIQPEFLPKSMRETQLRVIPNTFGIEFMYQLWSMFSSTPYKLSLTFTVTPVMISSAETTTMERVGEIDEGYYRVIPKGHAENA